MKLSPLSALAAAILCLSPLPAIAQQSGAQQSGAQQSGAQQSGAQQSGAQQSGAQQSGAQSPAPFRLQTALDLPDWLKVSGTVRPRYESVANQFTAGRTGGDDYFAWQLSLKAEASITRDIVLGGELIDVRLFSGDNGGAAPSEVDTLEPQQMYLAWRPKNVFLKDDALDLTAGRFTMDVGSRRLVSRSGMRFPLQSFDGVRAVWSHKNGVKATAFYTSPTTRLPTAVEAALGNDSEFNSSTDTAFTGVNLETPIAFGAIGEIYVYDLDENDATNQPTRNRDLITFGARLRSPQKKNDFDFEIEYAHQTGTNRATTAPADTIDLDHDAGMLHAELGYSLDLPWSPRVSLHYDLASGDDFPADQSDERFDPLFGDRAFELGPTGIWGAVARTNLDSPGVRLEIKPSGREEVMAMVRNVRLDASRDSFGSSGVRDTTGASGEDVGTHWEVRWRYQVVPNSLRLSIGFAGISQGEFLETAPNATGQGDPWYGYSEVTFSF